MGLYNEMGVGIICNFLQPLMFWALECTQEMERKWNEWSTPQHIGFPPSLFFQVPTLVLSLQAAGMKHFLTQGLNLVLPHCREILYLLSPQGRPWVSVCPFLKQDSWIASASLKVNMCTSHLGILLKCKLLFSRLGVGPETLHI